jgi:hypothetical protein
MTESGGAQLAFARPIQREREPTEHDEIGVERDPRTSAYPERRKRVVRLEHSERSLDCHAATVRASGTAPYAAECGG